MDLSYLLQGVLPPTLIALALISVGGNRLLPLAFALGLGAAYVILCGWPDLPHEIWRHPDGRAWLLWSAVGVSVVASFEHGRCLPRGKGRFAIAAAAAVAVWLVLRERSAGEGMTWVLAHVGGGVVLAAVMTLAGARLVDRAPSSPFLPALLGLVLLGDALCLWGGGGDGARLAGAAASILPAAILTAFWRRPFTVTCADGALCGALHALLLIGGLCIDDVDWLPVALAGLSPLAPLMLPKSFASERPRRWMLTALLLAAVPGGAALALAG